MSGKRAHGSRRPGKPARDERKKPEADQDYKVGYGKPPVSSQFVKGRSGNPRGRPRKVKIAALKLSDAPSEAFLEKEAYQAIELLENGRKVELTGVQAVMRAMKINALKGNRLSQKAFLELVREEEERQHKSKIDNYLLLEELKRKGEALIEDHKRRGLPPPDLLPHPEDIVLIRARGEAYVNGPETPEEVKEYEYRVRMRDHAFLCFAHSNSRSNRRRARDGKKGISVFGVLAGIENHFLPPRYRWKEDEERKLMFRYLDLGDKERLRLLQTEWAELEASRPPSPLSPEAHAEIRRITEEFLRDIGWKSGDAATG